jgi:genome maintenance exonuclease 1
VKPQNFELIRDDSGPIRYYIDPEGNKYRSVTSFVGQFSSGKEDIKKWQEAVGEVEAAKVLKAAGTRGTAIHLACENLLLNREWKDISMFYKQDFLTMKKHLEEHVDRVFVLEHQMYSKKLRLAGTVDCIAEYDGKLCIIDFKTSSKLKYREQINSYFLQCAAYAIMVWERYGIKISELVILMVVEGSANIEVFKEPLAKWGKELLILTKEANHE